MSRKSLAILLSCALLSSTVLTSAHAAPASAQPAPAAVSETASAPKNQPPLPAGPARIRSAQGLEDDDLGPLAIIGSIALATGVLVWLMFHDEDDDPTPGTGT